jgi:hypothetical protein
MKKTPEVVSPSGGRTNDRLLTSEEVARILALDIDGHLAPAEAVRYLCRSGKVRYCKVAGHLRFRSEWINEFIESNTVAPA